MRWFEFSESVEAKRAHVVAEPQSLYWLRHLILWRDARRPLVCLPGRDGCAQLVHLLEDLTLDLDVLKGSFKILFVLLPVRNLAQERVAAVM